MVKDNFEIQLDDYDISCFQVVTDNAANMKHAFELVMIEDENVDHDQDEADCENDELGYWKPIPLKIEGWIGCNSHLLQLVVHNGLTELKGYSRVQSILANVEAIATLSWRSSYCAYALLHKLPVPCDTRWNSYFRLYDHVIQHIEEINDAFKSIGCNDLVITSLKVISFHFL